MCVFVCVLYRAVYRHTLDSKSTLNMKNQQNDRKCIQTQTEQRISGSFHSRSGFVCLFHVYGWRPCSLLVEECMATVTLYSNDTWAENGFPTLYSTSRLFSIMLSGYTALYRQGGLNYRYNSRFQQWNQHRRLTNWVKLTKHLRVMISHQNSILVKDFQDHTCITAMGY